MKDLDILSLEKRKLRGDTFVVFKYLKNFHLVECTDLFSLFSKGRKN